MFKTQRNWKEKTEKCVSTSLTFVLSPHPKKKKKKKKKFTNFGHRLGVVC